eukprot:TRINITY_DN13137_c0_g1_i2.p1 TRINITY_DN13137_c0_g1~~TRINITY_DN13137_c0_g1_i2.p1  ORF type:complete len:150 (+),score=33.84 TRINITY_DN13137_c0_g1_i2:310-759(+)
MMFISRLLRKSLLSPIKTEASATASPFSSEASASVSSTKTKHNPLEEFFEAERNPNEKVIYGRGWLASELRLKSWDDLHKLWYVLLKEKNMLMSQRQMFNSRNLKFPNPGRLIKVRKSMCRLKHVLTERALQDPDPRRRAAMKKMINDL